MLPKPYILKFILHTPWFTHCDIGFHFAAATTSASSTSHTLHPAPNLHTLNSLSCVALNCAKKKKADPSPVCPQNTVYVSAVCRIHTRSCCTRWSAACCSVLQCVAVCMHPQKSPRCLQQEFYGAYSLNYQATHHCGLHVVRQISEIYILAGSASQYHYKCAIHSLECGMLQCVAVCCSASQCVAVCSRVLQ